MSKRSKKVFLELAAQFLSEYANRLSNDGCNDWEWPKHVMPLQKEQLMKSDDDDEGDDWRNSRFTYNWLVVQRLSDTIREIAKE